MTRFLYGVTFLEPVTLPGRKACTDFPPIDTGWQGLEGWSMRVVGDRLEVRAPGKAAVSQPAMREAEANGLTDAQTGGMVSIPLHRCVLRYVGDGDEVCFDAPSSALAARMKAPPPPPVKAAPAPTPAPQPQHAPTPARRGPPGARVIPPPPSTEIEVEVAKAPARRVDALQAEAAE